MYHEIIHCCIQAQNGLLRSEGALEGVHGLSYLVSHLWASSFLTPSLNWPRMAKGPGNQHMRKYPLGWLGKRVLEMHARWVCRHGGWQRRRWRDLSWPCARLLEATSLNLNVQLPVLWVDTGARSVEETAQQQSQSTLTILIMYVHRL